MLYTKHTNVMTGKDLLKIFTAPALFIDSAAGFQTLIVIEKLFLTGMRLTKIARLDRWQLNLQNQGKRNVLIIQKRLGFARGRTKNACGGFQDAGKAPTEIPVFDEFEFDGKLSIFRGLMLYLKLRDKLKLEDSKNHKLLLSIN